MNGGRLHQKRMTRKMLKPIKAALLGLVACLLMTCTYGLSSSSSPPASVQKIGHQVWREPANPKKHRDFMTPRQAGGQAVQAPRDNLLHHYVYFARLDSRFCFCFQGMSQVHQCRQYFSTKTHPSTRRIWRRSEYNEHHMGPWYCRLPKGINEAKRKRILKLLDTLIEVYGDDYDFFRAKRRSDHQGFEDRTAWIDENKRRRKSFRSNLKEILEQHGEDEDPAYFVWKAIGQQVQEEYPLRLKPNSNVPEILERKIDVTKKVLRKINPPAETKCMTRIEEPPLSSFRRKRLQRQYARDREILDELGGPIRSFVQAMDDSLDEIVNFRKANKGSSTEDFQKLLVELRNYRKQVYSVAKIINDHRWAFETIGGV